MDRIKIAQACLDHAGGSVYLEIGIGWGECFSEIRAPTKIGVDPAMAIRAPERLSARQGAREVRYFEVTSDRFFERNDAFLKKRPIDVAMIDGLHTHEQSLRDVKNCLPYLAEGGVIVVHDCNPTDAIMADPADSFADFRSKHGRRWFPKFDGRWSWTGDVWKTIVELRSTMPDIDVAVLDCDFGVGLIKKAKPDVMLSCGPDEIRRMTYTNLDSNREALLNLKPPEYLRSFLGTL